MSETNEKFEQWAVVDVMGHQRYCGRVTEQVIAGTGFVRVDVPGNDEFPAFSKLIGTSSIYAISPMDEAIVRDLARRSKATPIEAYKLLTGPAADPDYDDDLFDDEGDV